MSVSQTDPYPIFRTYLQSATAVQNAEQAYNPSWRGTRRRGGDPLLRVACCRFGTSIDRVRVSSPGYARYAAARIQGDLNRSQFPLRVYHLGLPNITGINDGE